jgi:hypothetical protein
MFRFIGVGVGIGIGFEDHTDMRSLARRAKIDPDSDPDPEKKHALLMSDFMRLPGPKSAKNLREEFYRPSLRRPILMGKNPRR